MANTPFDFDDFEAVARMAKFMAIHGDPTDIGFGKETRDAMRAIHAALTQHEGETYWILEWIAAARPPMHPEAGTGRQSFSTFEDAITFFKKRAPDAQFVSLTKRVVTNIDVSDEARAALNDT